ncbi:protein FMC1 homolog [Corticium candelabrum]|uniref:protein FMC1 homolog n=1 Tax=Corticium candelabrum TaxID=121492 RepID=UPI002E263D49|nr:protein FMC1 homolog [Corticium candelabrum]
MARPVSLLRNIVRELRLSRSRDLAKKVPLVSSAAYKYVLTKFRDGSEGQELVQDGEIWYLYMKSRREHTALLARYCRGERSIEDAAKMVGLQIPDKPKLDNKSL